VVGRHVAFAVPGDLATPTGGYAYDRRVITELRALGWRVDVVDLGGNFPRPTAGDRKAAHARLAEATADTVVIDGLALGVLPEEAADIARTRRLIALVHHPLALETGVTAEDSVALRISERAALAATRHVVVTSPTTAEILLADFGVARNRITIALPGTDAVTPAIGSTDGRVHLLCVGAVVPRKGYDVLIAALTQLADLPWRLTIVGDRTHSPDTAAKLDAAIARTNLSGRIEVTGAVSDAHLASNYKTADVFVLASHFEGYGMAAAEALAYGLPIIATAAGALTQTIPPDSGILIPPNDAAALAAALRAVIADGTRRQQYRDAARAAAKTLPTWRATAETIAQVIEAL
jgi:glycosyltransferase involved in cell wall biosynthesis